jgi:hypothetical protein
MHEPPEDGPKDESIDDLFARMRQEERDFQSTIADLPEIEIYGLVDAGGAGGSGNREEDPWTLGVVFLAWKSADGVLHSEKVRAEKSISRGELRKWMADIRPYSILHVRGRSAPHPRFGRKMMLSEIISVRHRDATLQAIATGLQQPVTFDDPDFGTFSLDRRLSWFEAHPLWQGKQVSLSLHVGESLKTKGCLEMARALWRDQCEWSRKVNDRAVAELLELKNGTWLGDDEKEVTSEQFKKRMKLQSIGVRPNGDFEFWHDDDDLFWGHSIHVWGNLADGPTHACIEG